MLTHTPSYFFLINKNLISLFSFFFFFFFFFFFLFVVGYYIKTVHVNLCFLEHFLIVASLLR